MNHNPILIKRALISVSDKTGLAAFAQALNDFNIEIISTGGTSKLLREKNIPVHDVSDLTGFPEMMDGRLKTLHPKVHGGILGLRDEHAAVAEKHGIRWIDLVVVNLYPFAETIQNPNATFEEAIENIDIGGPTMIRAAAKNMGWVGVLVDPADYTLVLQDIRAKRSLDFSLRQQLAQKAFAHTAHYDAVIHHYLLSQDLPAGSKAVGENQDLPHQPLDNKRYFSPTLNFHLEKFADLRYGENPHQVACAYRFSNNSSGILEAKQHQGKQLSYNNITDADAAIACIREFSAPACVIMKHANPCGVAVADQLYAAWQQAYEADSISAFGGIVALNQLCDEKVAQAISQIFIEVLIAPAYTPQALKILASKTNLRVLELNFSVIPYSAQEFKFIDGGMLIQSKDTTRITQHNLQFVTQLQPTVEEVTAMLFAWPVLKHVKSNAILIAKNNTTLGIGAGQVSRVDAVESALKKAKKNLSGAILASDAFFPFRDSIDRLAGTGIRAIIQPGGSVRDEEVITACNEHQIAMVFTGIRCFKH